MMVRWPAGLHGQTTPATGARNRRYVSTGQRDYWRHSMTELHASTPVVVVPQGLFFGPQGSVNVPSTAVASVGPQGAGERWHVDLVQVQTSTLYGQPPLVVQQITAQALGANTTPPPPIVAQVWRSASGTLQHLLAQTSSGGGDDLGLACSLAPGQQITVVWYGAQPGDNAWAVLTGTRHTLDV